jgi:hypothetical protein
LTPPVLALLAQLRLGGGGHERLADDGTWHVVAGLGLPANPVAASPTFGKGKEKFTAYVTNFGSSWDIPAVVKVDLCERIDWDHR